MTFVTAVMLSAFRAAVLTVAILFFSHRWSRWLDAASARGRFLPWVLLLIPGLVPELLLGYAYTPWVVGRPARAEAVCALLLGLRLIPVGVIAWQLTPRSPLNSSAWHLRALLPLRTLADWLHFCWVGPIQRTISPAAIVWLLAFQEFELAALLKAVSWTDAIFTEQQLGREFSDLVRTATGPTLLQVIVVFAAMRSLSPNTQNDGVPVAPPVPSFGQFGKEYESILTGVAIGLVTIVSWGLLVIVPLSSLLWGLPAGFVQLLGQSLRWQGLLRELCGGLAVSVTAACLAWNVAGWMSHPPVTDRGLRRIWSVIACLPGLSGSLVLSLGVLTAFQRSWLSGLYNTPVMWVLASAFFLLPRAVLLRLWLARGAVSAVALTRFLSESPSAEQRRAGRAIAWRLDTEPRFLAMCCLVYWSYLELTLAALLAPTGVPSGLVRLYNFLHFGRTAALSAEMTVLLGCPLLLAAVVWGLARKGRV